MKAGSSAVTIVLGTWALLTTMPGCDQEAECPRGTKSTGSRCTQQLPESMDVVPSTFESAEDAASDVAGEDAATGEDTSEDMTGPNDTFSSDGTVGAVFQNELCPQYAAVVFVSPKRSLCTNLLAPRHSRPQAHEKHALAGIFHKPTDPFRGSVCSKSKFSRTYLPGQGGTGTAKLLQGTQFQHTQPHNYGVTTGNQPRHAAPSQYCVWRYSCGPLPTNTPENVSTMSLYEESRLRHASVAEPFFAQRFSSKAVFEQSLSSDYLSSTASVEGRPVSDVENQGENDKFSVIVTVQSAVDWCTGVAETIDAQKDAHQCRRGREPRRNSTGWTPRKPRDRNPQQRTSQRQHL